MTTGTTEDYRGILGLGKKSTITNSNFVIEWALQNHQSPVVFLELGYGTDDSYCKFGTEDSDTYTYWTTYTDATSDYWDIPIKTFNVDGSAVYSTAGNALLDSTAPYYAIPKSLFTTLNPD